MRNTLLRSVSLALITVLTLAACGWHPRGSQEVPLQMRQLRLVTEQPNAALTLKLRRALQGAGVELVDVAGAGPSLHIGTEQRVSRKISLDRDARSAEQTASVLAMTLDPV